MVTGYTDSGTIDIDAVLEAQAKLGEQIRQAKLEDQAKLEEQARDVSQPASETIQAVICRCDGDSGLKWSTTTIPSSHAIFDLDPSPVPSLLEVPLVFQRLTAHTKHTAALDNRMVTFMNINPTTGFAPPEWQQCVGNVLVARKDRKPLLEQHVEVVWMHCDGILDRFGDGEGPPTDEYSKQAFEEYWTYYKEGMILNDCGRRREWQDVKSPYEV